MTCDPDTSGRSSVLGVRRGWLLSKTGSGQTARTHARHAKVAHTDSPASKPLVLFLKTCNEGSGNSQHHPDFDTVRRVLLRKIFKIAIPWGHICENENSRGVVRWPGHLQLLQQTTDLYKTLSSLHVQVVLQKTNLFGITRMTSHELWKRFGTVCCVRMAS